MQKIAEYDYLLAYMMTNSLPCERGTLMAAQSIVHRVNRAYPTNGNVSLELDKSGKTRIRAIIAFNGSNPPKTDNVRVRE